MDRVAVSGADLVEHGLAGDAESAGGFVELDVTVGGVGHETGSRLVAEADAPWCVRRGLLCGEQALGQPSADRLGADAELAGGLMDRDVVSAFGLAGCCGDRGAFTDARDPRGGER